MVQVFVVWSCDRKKKISFVANETVDTVITKASLKMNVNGKSLVLEENGTLIDDDDVLKCFKDKIFILLKEGEDWKQVLNDDSIIDLETPQPALPNAKEKLDNNKNVIPVHQVVPPEDRYLDVNNENNSTVNENIPVVENARRPDTLNARCISNNLNLWQNYHYDWSNLSQLYIRKLSEGDKSKRLMKEVVHKVIEQMREISHTICAKVLKRIARELMEQYPDTLEDKNMGRRYSSGSVILFDMLKEHNNYLNRLDNKRPFTSTRKVTTKEIKLHNKLKVGTVNWQPEDHPDEETDDTVKEKQKWLRDTYLILEDGPVDPTMHDNVLKNLVATFKSQREFFNDFDNVPTVDDLVLAWPILLRKEYFFHHYQQLMGHPLETLRTEFRNHRDAIYAYARGHGLTQSETPDDRVIIEIIFSYYNENSENLIKDCPPGEETLVGFSVPEQGPFILTQELDGLTTYHLTFDSKIMATTEDFFEAIMWAFSTFFVWNRLYPTPYAHTLESLQRCILNLHPEQGSRSYNSHLVLKRVNTFFKKLQRVVVITNNNHRTEESTEEI